MQINDLSDTIIAKSDQLNADDLIGAPKTIKVSGVKRYQENGAECFMLNYEGDCGRPYKPCKSMRRVLLFAWGKDGSKWIGRSLTVYCDPSVKWAGKEVGGIRISAMSDIEKAIKLNISLSRGQKREVKIEVLQAPQKKPWIDEALAKHIENATPKILDGSTTSERVINKLESIGVLSDEQKAVFRNIGNTPDNQNNEPPVISDDDFE